MPFAERHHTLMTEIGMTISTRNTRYIPRYNEVVLGFKLSNRVPKIHVFRNLQVHLATNTSLQMSAASRVFTFLLVVFSLEPR